MKSSVFLIEIKDSISKVISAYGYNTDFTNMEDSFDNTLKNGRVIYQTQSIDSSTGTIFLTISLEYIQKS